MARPVDAGGEGGGGGWWLTSADYDVLLVRGRSWCIVYAVFCAWPGHTYVLAMWPRCLRSFTVLSDR